MFYQIARSYKAESDRDNLVYAYEIAAIKKHTKSKDIDLNKEIIKDDLFGSVTRKTSFKRQLRQEILDDLFKKEKEKKE